MPWGLINKLLREGKFKMEGTVIERSYRLKLNDYIECPKFLNFEKPLVHNSGLLGDFKSWVIYEDDDIIAINKPAGIAAQGGTDVKVSVDVIAEEYCNAKIMHRIDKSVSGVMVLAKHNQACQFDIVDKKYVAIVLGKPEASGEINDRIDRIKAKQVVGEEGKEAKTLFKVLQSVQALGTWYSLLDVEIKTGRKHQVRVHCAQSIQCPILGDEKYGGGKRNRVFLHALSCQVNSKHLQAPLPQAFKNTLLDLGFNSRLLSNFKLI